MNGVIAGEGELYSAILLYPYSKKNIKEIDNSYNYLLTIPLYMRK